MNAANEEIELERLARIICLAMDDRPDVRLPFPFTPRKIGSKTIDPSTRWTLYYPAACAIYDDAHRKDFK
jgi:hypothetical protein